ncbi:hypothetical protein BaRGS_00021005, partial [Batillaria attramentaria]
PTLVIKAITYATLPSHTPPRSLMKSNHHANTSTTLTLIPVSSTGRHYKEASVRTQEGEAPDLCLGNFRHAPHFPKRYQRIQHDAILGIPGGFFANSGQILTDFTSSSSSPN